MFDAQPDIDEQLTFDSNVRPHDPPFQKMGDVVLDNVNKLDWSEQGLEVKAESELNLDDWVAYRCPKFYNILRSARITDLKEDEAEEADGDGGLTPEQAVAYSQFYDELENHRPDLSPPNLRKAARKKAIANYPDRTKAVSQADGDPKQNAISDDLRGIVTEIKELYFSGLKNQDNVLKGKIFHILAMQDKGEIHRIKAEALYELINACLPSQE